MAQSMELFERFQASLKNFIFCGIKFGEFSSGNFHFVFFCVVVCYCLFLFQVLDRFCFYHMFYVQRNS